MTDAKSANWYSDGENADCRMDDLFAESVVAPDCDGAAADETIDTRREPFLLTIVAEAEQRLVERRAVNRTKNVTEERKFQLSQSNTGQFSGSVPS